MFKIVNLINGDLVAGGLSYKEALKYMDDFSEEIGWDAFDFYMIVKER